MWLCSATSLNDRDAGMRQARNCAREGGVWPARSGHCTRDDGDMASLSPDDLLAAIRHLPRDEGLEFIQRAAREAEEGACKLASIAASTGSSAGRRLTVAELLATRLTPPPGSDRLTLADMERAIGDGASRRGSP